MAQKCSIESLYGIGQLKSCPYINEPVVNQFGWIMNPPVIEKYQLSDGHIFIIPEQENRLWKIYWIITKNGAGSYGNTKPDLFMFSYQKAISEILEHHKLTDANRLEVKDIFEKKFDPRRTFSMPKSDSLDVIEEKFEYISPFENIEFGTIGEQLDLF